MGFSGKLPLESYDDVILRMLAGSTFVGYDQLDLPSGVTLDADEAQAFTALFADDGGIECNVAVHQHQPFLDLGSPLPSANTNWTGGFKANLRSLIARAVQAAQKQEDMVSTSAPKRKWRSIFRR